VTNFDIEQVKRAERAKVDRWFTEDKAGVVFHVTHTRAVRIPASDAERWRSKGYALVDDNIAAMIDTGKISGGISVILVLILVCAQSVMTIRFGGGAELALMLAAGAWPLMTTLRHFQSLRDLRAEIAGTLSRGVPLPRDYPGAVARRNLFRLSLTLLICGVVAAMLASYIFPQIIEAIPAGVYFAVVPFAWALHFAARAADRAA
jgi:hypothetical protein